MSDREGTATGISRRLEALLDARLNAAHAVEREGTVNAVMDAEELHGELLKTLSVLEADRDRLNVLEEMLLAEIIDAHTCIIESWDGPHDSFREAADAELRRRRDAR